MQRIDAGIDEVGALKRSDRPRQVRTMALIWTTCEPRASQHVVNAEVGGQHRLVKRTEKLSRMRYGVLSIIAILAATVAVAIPTRTSAALNTLISDCNWAAAFVEKSREYPEIIYMGTARDCGNAVKIRSLLGKSNAEIEKTSRHFLSSCHFGSPIVEIAVERFENAVKKLDGIAVSSVEFWSKTFVEKGRRPAKARRDALNFVALKETCSCTAGIHWLADNNYCPRVF